MAIGAALMAADHPPERVRVDADCTLDQLPSGGHKRTHASAHKTGNSKRPGSGLW
jgi:hypothetical protein